MKSDLSNCKRILILENLRDKIKSILLFLIVMCLFGMFSGNISFYSAMIVIFTILYIITSKKKIFFLQKNELYEVD